MSEEENERDFMKACFNVVAGLEVKNENQAIAKEAILDEVEYLTKENQQLKKDYQVLRVINNSLNDLVNSCQEEIRKLKQEIKEITCIPQEEIEVEYE